MTEAQDAIRRNADWYAERICESWRSTVEGILETGRRIAEAKADLPHGEFGKMVAERLPFKRQWAHRLLRIGSDTRLANVQSTIHLPAAAETLYAITMLPDATFERAVADGTIHGDCKKADILKLMRVPLASGEQPVHEDCVSRLEDLIEQEARFGCIYADPPWQYGNQGTRAATGNHYDTMPLDDICALPIEQIAADEAHLHLWTTNAFLFDAKRVIEAWGFEFKSMLVWCKPQVGIGNYWRVNTEYLLLATRGGAQFLDTPEARQAQLNSWIQHDRLAHSEKPEMFRSLIEKVSPGPYIELFARKSLPRWTAWGNQIERGLYSPTPREEAA